MVKHLVKPWLSMVMKMPKPVYHNIGFTQKELEALYRFLDGYYYNSHLHNGDNAIPAGRVERMKAKTRRKLKEITKRKEK